MIGFYLSIGKQGSGKTALITKFLIDNLKDGIKIYSNYTLFGIDYIPVTFNNKIERDKGKLDILEELKKDPNKFNNSIMLIDEIHIYFDSRDFLNKNQRIIQTFFSQLRKRRILLLATTQFIMHLDIRIRRQCMNVFLMRHLGKSDKYDGDIFEVETHDIDGYNTKFISSYRIDLQPVFEKYNTEELIT